MVNRGRITNHEYRIELVHLIHSFLRFAFFRGRLISIGRLLRYEVPAVTNLLLNTVSRGDKVGEWRSLFVPYNAGQRVDLAAFQKSENV